MAAVEYLLTEGPYESCRPVAIIWQVEWRQSLKLLPLLFSLFGLPALSAQPIDSHSAAVRVSPRDHRYLELADGKPYIPIGLNMISPPNVRRGEDEALRGMEAWIASLSSNGGNYIRVWLSNDFWDVEHDKSGVYDEEKAKRIDRMLELCRKYGIRVKLTMEHFRSIPNNIYSDCCS